MKLKITVHGVAYEVEVEVLDPGDGFAMPTALPPVRSTGAPTPAPAPAARAVSAAASATSASSTAAPTGQGTVTSPIAGVVVELKCQVGQAVQKDQVVVVIEAMKMNTSIASPLSGTVKRILVAAGDSVREAQALVEIE